MRSVLSRCLAAAILLAAGARAADEPSTDKLNKKIDNFTLTDAKGKEVSLHGFKDPKPAIDELLAGKDVSVPATQAVGCTIARDRTTKATGKVTYYKDVQPILQNGCQTCHRPGEVGPFPLMTYKQAVNWAPDIKEYT